MWLRRRQIWSLGSPAREETSRSGPCALKPAPFAGPLTASTARSEAPPLSRTAPPDALMFPHRAILQLAAHTRRVPMARRAILIHPRTLIAVVYVFNAELHVNKPLIWNSQQLFGADYQPDIFQFRHNDPQLYQPVNDDADLLFGKHKHQHAYIFLRNLHVPPISDLFLWQPAC